MTKIYNSDGFWILHVVPNPMNRGLKWSRFHSSSSLRSVQARQLGFMPDASSDKQLGHPGK